MEVDRIPFLIFELLFVCFELLKDFGITIYWENVTNTPKRLSSLFALDARPNYPLTRTLLFPKNKQISVFLQKQIVKDTTEIGKL